MNLTRLQMLELETVWHWNAHNRTEENSDPGGICYCDEPPVECQGCGSKYPYGLIRDLCGDCELERTGGYKP